MHKHTHARTRRMLTHTHINVLRDPWLLMHRCERKPIGRDPVSGLLVWDSSSLAWTQLVFLPSSLSMHTWQLCCIPQQNWKSAQHWYILYDIRDVGAYNSSYCRFLLSEQQGIASISALNGSKQYARHMVFGLQSSSRVSLMVKACNHNVYGSDTFIMA